MYAAGTGSSHTVCQMPVTAVYQMLLRFEHLLAARLRAGVGRVADGDDELLVAATASAHSVMSNENGS